MPETSVTLFNLIRAEPGGGAWERVVELYTPLIRAWLRRHGLRNQDVDDLVQEVLAVLVRKLAEFQREPRTGAFRRWLRSITVNCLRDFWRAQRVQPRGTGATSFLAVIEQLEDADSRLSRQWDREHNNYITRRLLAMIRPRVEAKTWLAFRRVVLEGECVHEVARELKLSANAVFIAKSRVLRLLREEGRGFID